MQTSIVNCKLKYEDLVKSSENIFYIWKDIPEEDKSDFVSVFFKKICLDYLQLKLLESKHMLQLECVNRIKLEELLKYISNENYSMFIEIIEMIASSFYDINDKLNMAIPIDEHIQALDEDFSKTNIYHQLLGQIKILTSRLDNIDSRMLNLENNL